MIIALFNRTNLTSGVESLWCLTPLFNNISVISWRSVLLVEETGVPRENHRPAASNWQTLSHNVVSSKAHLSGIRTLEVIATDCISSCKSNHYTTTMTPYDFYVTKKYIMYKVQDYESAIYTSMLITQLNVVIYWETTWMTALFHKTEVYAYIASLILPPFIRVHIPSQESEWVCISCIRVIKRKFKL